MGGGGISDLPLPPCVALTVQTAAQRASQRDGQTDRQTALERDSKQEGDTDEDTDGPHQPAHAGLNCPQGLTNGPRMVSGLVQGPA